LHSGCDIGDPAIEGITKSLESLISLRNLSLDFFIYELTDVGVQGLGHALKNLPLLHTIELSLR